MSGRAAPKGATLQRLAAIGYPIPPFVIVEPADVAAIEAAQNDSEKAARIATLARRAREALGGASYAVRSNATLEDGARSSMAGRFHTELNVEPDDLERAICTVIAECSSKCSPANGELSLIIQVFIEARVSGVTFTRSPSGGREMVVEYAAVSRGEVVAGAVTPEVFRRYHGSSTSCPEGIPSCEIFERIEADLGFPCDVEWCTESKGAEETIWILQARAVSTLDETAFRQSVYLDSVLPKSDPFRFEKNEISEVAPRPTPMTLDLLVRLYENGGPIARAYDRIGVRYELRGTTHESSPLRVVGNELYCDKDRETAAVYPALRRHRYGGSRLRWWPPADAIRTIANIGRLAVAPTPDIASLTTIVARQLESPSTTTSVGEAVAHFLTAYETIFTINLFAAREYHRFEKELGKDRLRAASMIGRGVVLAGEPEPPVGLQGNTLDLASRELFEPAELSAESDALDSASLERLPARRRGIIEAKCRAAAGWIRLREIGRWLTVKAANEIRTSVRREAASRGIDYDLALFSGFDELPTIAPDELTQRRVLFERFGSFNLPPILTDSSLDSERAMRGVSGGKASGTLVRRHEISSSSGDLVLFTELLSPDLVVEFDHIRGIVSLQGGALSHLAIMAREFGIPVVVCSSDAAVRDRIGTRITIDGDHGEISDSLGEFL